ncbi:MAG: DUF6092 family protein [Thaumarchaeota archaeon]|jgi:hypothetical protein|nr:DUF6092 family protein [Candidatus Geocrenenecus arthurdayi]MCL7390892.1 DUF6092 family protein [Candidatus Geocrenenecus arthurdayi]MCL7403339.1 DUF6092 family protein [Candidatus Geocrenenecus arthurdayi]
MPMENILEDEHFQLLAFLLTSARGCIDEPPIYGPLRLIDAADKLISIIVKKYGRQLTELQEIRRKIEKARNLVLTNEEEFTKTLDELVRSLSKIIKKA